MNPLNLYDIASALTEEERMVQDSVGRLVAQSRQIARVGRSSRERDPA